ncbi:MAG: smalltalk protein [Prevotella sp.]|nr:smalltalk protein [Prevotella sp.]MCH5312602.1 smalltalk protein [Prevotella sp.]
MKKETWKFILQTIAAVLTAIATSLGVSSCMAML